MNQISLLTDANKRQVLYNNNENIRVLLCTYSVYDTELNN